MTTHSVVKLSARSNPDKKQQSKKGCMITPSFVVWRREWDLNPRYPYEVHTISNRAPSTPRTSLHLANLFFNVVNYISISVVLQMFVDSFFIFVLVLLRMRVKKRGSGKIFGCFLNMK